MYRQCLLHTTQVKLLFILSSTTQNAVHIFYVYVLCNWNDTTQVWLRGCSHIKVNILWTIIQNACVKLWYWYVYSIPYKRSLSLNIFKGFVIALFEHCGSWWVLVYLRCTTRRGLFINTLEHIHEHVYTKRTHKTRELNLVNNKPFNAHLTALNRVTTNISTMLSAHSQPEASRISAKSMAYFGLFSMHGKYIAHKHKQPPNANIVRR